MLIAEFLLLLLYSSVTIKLICIFPSTTNVRPPLLQLLSPLHWYLQPLFAVQFKSRYYFMDMECLLAHLTSSRHRSAALPSLRGCRVVDRKIDYMYSLS